MSIAPEFGINLLPPQDLLIPKRELILVTLKNARNDGFSGDTENMTISELKQHLGETLLAHAQTPGFKEKTILTLATSLVKEGNTEYGNVYQQIFHNYNIPEETVDQLWQAARIDFALHSNSQIVGSFMRQMREYLRGMRISTYLDRSHLNRIGSSINQGDIAGFYANVANLTVDASGKLANYEAGHLMEFYGSFSPRPYSQVESNVLMTFVSKNIPGSVAIKKAMGRLAIPITYEDYVVYQNMLMMPVLSPLD